MRSQSCSTCALSNLCWHERALRCRLDRTNVRIWVRNPWSDASDLLSAFGAELHLATNKYCLSTNMLQHMSRLCITTRL